MNKTFAAILTMATLGLGGSALAQTEDPQSKDTTKHEMKKKGEMEKKGMETGAMAPGTMQSSHIALVDLYLVQARNNLETLSRFSSMTIGKKERADLSEVERNLNTSIDGAIKHVDAIKGPEAASFADVKSNLTEVRTAARKLRTAKPEELSALIEPAQTGLQAAQGSFQDAIKGTSYTSIGTCAPSERQPVRGGAPETGAPPSGTMPPSGTTPPRPGSTTSPSGNEEELPPPAQPSAPPSGTTGGGKY